MLSQEILTLVKSTAPILAEHGETLTHHFYQRMFSHNPEVISLFNSARQQSGQQQRALANAILAYASNIDNLTAIGSAVELIGQKHASLMIQPHHYPIVRENLLASICEVLSIQETDEVITAWGQAYDLLAQILMNREKTIYEENAKKPGGWEGFKRFRIIRKEKESSVITSVYMTPADGSSLPYFKPGQYITVRIPTPNGQTTMRNYSLSDKPGKNWFRISVKREVPPQANTPPGYVSNSLHDSVEVGDTLEIAPPCGEFFFNTDTKCAYPLVFLGAGVGITPLMSMLLSALETVPQQDIIFIHGSLNEEVQAFKQTLDSLAEKYPHLTVHYRYSEPAREEVHRTGNKSTGFIDRAFLESFISKRNASYYFCGPSSFMVGLYRTLRQWSIPSEQIHFEFFGSHHGLEDAA